MAGIMTPILLVGTIVGSLVSATALAIRYRIHAVRTRRVMEQDDDDDVCVACQGSDTRALGPNAYRCNACGFTWGSGLSQLSATAQREAIEAMPADARRASGIEDLEQAKLLLLAATGAVEAALEASRADLAGADHEPELLKHPHIVQALTNAREAREHVIAAKQKLQGPGSNTLDVLDVEVVDLGGMHYLFDSFDSRLTGGGGFVDVNVGDEKIQHEIEELARVIRGMLASVERALAVVEP